MDGWIIDMGRSFGAFYRTAYRMEAREQGNMNSARLWEEAGRRGKKVAGGPVIAFHSPYPVYVGSGARVADMKSIISDPHQGRETDVVVNVARTEGVLRSESTPWSGGASGCAQYSINKMKLTMFPLGS
jgi:hypothetical protein